MKLVKDLVHPYVEIMVMKDLDDTFGVARYLGLKPATLRIMRSNGTGPDFVKMEKQVRYFKSDVDAWLMSRRRQNTLKKRAQN